MRFLQKCVLVYNEQNWAPFMESTQPEKEFPASAGRITAFQRLIIIKIIRPDRLESAMQFFVAEAFGGQ